MVMLVFLMAFYIQKHEPIAPGLRRIAHEQIGIVLHHFSDAAVPVDKRVHSLRTRCKKIRGLLRLPWPLMGEAFEVEDQRFRSAAKELAEYREMDIYDKTIKSLNGSNGAVSMPRAPIPVAAIERSIEIMATGLDAVDDWPFDAQGFDDLAPGFSRTYQNCLDAWNETIREPSDAYFHRLRRMTKYHWYQVRILERLNRPKIHPRRQDLRKLQLTLGDAHDLVLLQSLLESRDDLDMPLLKKAITRKRELYADAMMTGRRLYAKPVNELVADFSRWWQESRR